MSSYSESDAWTFLFIDIRQRSRHSKSLPVTPFDITTTFPAIRYHYHVSRHSISLLRSRHSISLPVRLHYQSSIGKRSEKKFKWLIIAPFFVTCSQAELCGQWKMYSRRQTPTLESKEVGCSRDRAQCHLCIPLPVRSFVIRVIKNKIALEGTYGKNASAKGLTMILNSVIIRRDTCFAWYNYSK